MKCDKADGVINTIYIQIFYVYINAWVEGSNET